MNEYILFGKLAAGMRGKPQHRACATCSLFTFILSYMLHNYYYLLIYFIHQFADLVLVRHVLGEGWFRW